MIEYRASLSNELLEPIKYVYFGVVMFGNVVINKILGRHVRTWLYKMFGVKLG